MAAFKARYINGGFSFPTVKQTNPIRSFKVARAQAGLQPAMVLEYQDTVIPVITQKACKAVSNLLKPIILKSLWNTAKHTEHHAASIKKIIFLVK